MLGVSVLVVVCWYWVCMLFVYCWWWVLLCEGVVVEVLWLVVLMFVLVEFVNILVFLYLDLFGLGVVEVVGLSG